MTRYTPLWEQNASYPANVDRILPATLWPASCSTGGAGTAVGNTMTVSVAAGTAAVALSAGNNTALCKWDAAEVVTLAAAPASGNTRIDLVVVTVRDSAIDAGSNNDFIVTAVTGTPSTGTPAVPAVPNNSYCICQVTVIGGAANLNGSTVVDRRVPMNPRETLHAKVYRNAALVIGSSVATFPFDTVSSDPAGLWVPASNSFNLPAGVWQVSAVLNGSAVGTGQALSAVVTLAGSGVLSAVAHSSFAYGFGPTVTGSVRVPGGGGTVLLQSATNGGNLAMLPGVANCFMCVDYLGAG